MSAVPLELAFQVRGTRSNGCMRRPVLADVHRIASICQDPDIQRYTRVPIPYARQDAERFVDGVGQRWDAGTPANFVVTVDDVLVGTVGIVHLDERDRWGEIGYWAAPEARGQGITTAAVRRLCAWAFHDVGLHRLELQTAAGNIGSEVVAARAGFVREGVRRSAAVLRAVAGMPEERVDMTVWGLLPGDLR